MSTRKSQIEMQILEYFAKKKSPVTFVELYANLSQFPKQSIRSRMYLLVKKGIVERAGRRRTPKKRSTVVFKLKK